MWAWAEVSQAGEAEEGVVVVLVVLAHKISYDWLVLGTANGIVEIFLEGFGSLGNGFSPSFFFIALYADTRNRREILACPLPHLPLPSSSPKRKKSKKKSCRATHGHDKSFLLL